VLSAAGRVLTAPQPGTKPPAQRNNRQSIHTTTGRVDSPNVHPFCPPVLASVPFRVPSCFEDLCILCFRLNKTCLYKNKKHNTCGQHEETPKRVHRVRVSTRQHRTAIPIPASILEFRLWKQTGQQVQWQGIALDAGAQRSCIGLAQARAYCTRHVLRLTLRSSSRTFIFGARIYKSLGALTILAPTPSGILRLQLDVVPPDVPALLGLDVMDSHNLQFLSVSNELECVTEDWKMPVVRQLGHGYLIWTPLSNVCYTRTQLERLHRQLYHPSVGKLLNLLRRADPNKVSPETRCTLKEISASCHPCQKYSSKPISFQFRTPGDIIFNQTLSLDLGWLDSRPVPHVVDQGTKFSAACVLLGKMLPLSGRHSCVAGPTSTRPSRVLNDGPRQCIRVQGF
jgi:hypothetical protein